MPWQHMNVQDGVTGWGGRDRVETGRESWGIWETTFAILSDFRLTVTVNVCSINEYGRALHNGLLQI